MRPGKVGTAETAYGCPDEAEKQANTLINHPDELDQEASRSGQL